MFLLNELILSSPLLLYVYLRIRKLIPKKPYRYLYTVFYVLLLLAFPVAETLSHHSGKGWIRFPMIAGYYSLPLLLYLVLIAILSDLIIGVGRLLKMISRETIRSPGIRKIRLGILLVIPSAIVLGGALNYRHLQYHEYSIEVPRKSSEIGQLKIAFAADFHLGELTDDRFMERFVGKINALNPDIVLIGGDVLESDRRDEKTDRFEAQFRRIRSKYGVYGVPGNHESHRGNERDFFGKAGISLLEDAVRKIDGAFYLAGRNYSHSRNRKSIDELLKDTPNNFPMILLDHSPIDFDGVSRRLVDIQLSGHTHHGQLFPLNFITQHRYELSWGHKKKLQTHFFVTSGVQIWGPPVRTVGASEILVINIVFRDKA